MNAKRKIIFDPRVRPESSHLEPIVDLLLAHGNQLAYDFRWGQNRTGLFCHLSKPIDFDLIEKTFEFPDFVKLYRDKDEIECNVTWVTIKGGVG